MITLETERLRLSVCGPEDFQAHAEMSADPEVTRFLTADGRPLSRFAAWQGFCAQLGHWHLRGFGMFTVRERATGAFVGRVGPWYPEGWPDFEVGWTLCPRYWGRGYATEAGNACLAYAFNDLRRTRVISLILPDNTRSVRVAERLGETLHSEVSLPHLPPDRKVLLYELHKEDWQRLAR